DAHVQNATRELDGILTARPHAMQHRRVKLFEGLVGVDFEAPDHETFAHHPRGNGKEVFFQPNGPVVPTRADPDVDDFLDRWPTRRDHEEDPHPARKIPQHVRSLSWLLTSC